MYKKKTSKGLYIGKRSVPFFFLLSIFFFLPIYDVFGATFSVSPAFITDPATTNITFTTTGGSNRWTSFDADTGVWDNGGDLGDGTHTWDSEFGNNNAGKHIVVEYFPHPGSCYGTDLATCMGSGQVTASQEVCLTDNTECGGGGGGTATSTFNCVKLTATSTECLIQVVDNPNQDYFNGVLLFFLLTGGVLFIFKKK